MVINSKEVLDNLLATDLEAKKWDATFKLKNDPRITKIGGFLRRTSLDELPQLFNVLKGEMSLVGPRPIITAELERYNDEVDYYLLSKPGMTGLWQVSGRSDVDYETRVYLDAWYVKNWSMWNDIAILFKTISVVLNKRWCILILNENVKMVSEQHFSILQGQQQQITLMLILIFFIIMFIVSPVLSFFGLIVFFSLIRIDERLIRFLFAMLALISGVAIYASRFVHPVELGGDDFSNQYYPLFKSLSSGASIFSSQFGGGVEFGLAAIYKVIGFFNPTATYWEIFFIVSFLCVFLYYIWFERFIVSRLSGRDITLCLASALLFLVFLLQRN
jgi:undecaprenyl-phosphate galactose phosphotransferase